MSGAALQAWNERRAARLAAARVRF